MTTPIFEKSAVKHNRAPLIGPVPRKLNLGTITLIVSFIRDKTNYKISMSHVGKAFESF